MLDVLEQRLRRHKPFRFKAEAPQAAVLVAITDSDSPKVILTKRAITMSSHKGEVAFPGGMAEPSDHDLKHTALREAEEEVGIDPKRVKVLGSLGQLMSVHNIQVTPWVGVVPEGIQLIPCARELDHVFQVPIDFFLQDHRHHTDEILFKCKTHFVPAYEYDGNIIWGLTAYVLVELLNVGFDAGIPMRPRPEHQ